MKKTALLLLCCVLTYGSLWAQSNKANSRKRKLNWHHNFTAAVGFGDNHLAGSLGWAYLRGLGKYQRLKIGPGIRLNGIWGDNIHYTSAPPRLAKDEELTDTLQLKDPFLGAVNLGLYASYDITTRLTIGFNIDAIGLSIGGKKEGDLYASTLPVSPLFVPENKPTSFNALLGGNNDLGTLNSEFYVAYGLSQKFYIKLGIQYLFTEYKTPEKFVNDNDRYRAKSTLFFAGLSWYPFMNDVNCPKRPKPLKVKTSKKKKDIKNEQKNKVPIKSKD